MVRVVLISIAALFFVFGDVRAQERNPILAASPELSQSGMLKYLLPRFSLKTGIRFDLVELGKEGEIPTMADLVLTRAKPLGKGGRIFMLGLGHSYYVTVRDTNDKRSLRFADWLVSEIGRATIDAFSADGVQVFTAVTTTQALEVEIAFEGDVVAGKSLAYRNCGRCHVVGQENRMKGIGSTPSFALLRTFPDWQDRFQIYYILNPHPSFSQIIDITEPFDPAFPPPIVPLALSSEELDDILAFVATIQPADLGAPLKHQ